MMLSQKKSGAVAGLNYLLTLPVGLFLLFFQQVELGAQSAGNFQKWKQGVAVDTIVTFDPETKIETVQFVKMNTENKTDEHGADVFYKESHVMPEFPGGREAMGLFLGQNIKYPADAKKANIEGKVFISFIVEQDGSLRDFREVKASPAPSLFEEALRVLKSMPNWKPGQIDGKPVAVQVVIPVMFKLD